MNGEYINYCKLSLYVKYPCIVKIHKNNDNIIKKKVKQNVNVINKNDNISANIDIVETKFQTEKLNVVEEAIVTDTKLINAKLKKAKNEVDVGIGIIPILVKKEEPLKTKSGNANKKNNTKVVTNTMPKEILNQHHSSNSNNQQDIMEQEEETRVPKGGGGCCTIS